MPTLTTFLIALPVYPFHSPERTRCAKSAIRSSTSCTCATTSTPSTTSELSLRHPQRDVQHRPVLGHVDPLAGEHRVPALLRRPDSSASWISRRRVSSVTRFFE